MFDEADQPKKKPELRPLDPLSIVELEAYIADMEGEIVRVRREIAVKQAHAQAADAFFKMPKTE